LIQQKMPYSSYAAPMVHRPTTNASMMFEKTMPQMLPFPPWSLYIHDFSKFVGTLGGLVIAQTTVGVVVKPYFVLCGSV
jgi:hypothetical protein